MKNKLTLILIFAAILASSFYFGFSRLHDFSGVDEPYWSYDRVPKFWNSIKNAKWKSTNICDKPGVTLAAISGLGLPFTPDDPKDYQKLRYNPKTPEQLEKIRDIYYYLRLPVFIFTLAVLPFFYFFIRKILGTRAARFSLIFIGFSPIILGISLIINSDSILWIVTALSTLSLFAFFKTEEKKYLLISGALLGLSVITKYVANILFLYFFLLFFLEYVFHAHEKTGIAKYLKQSAFNYFLLLAAAVATAFAFFPATWVKLSVLLNATLLNDVFKSVWPIFALVIAFLAIDGVFLKNSFSGRVFNFFAAHKLALAKFAGAIFIFFAIIVFSHTYLNANFYDIQEFISSPKGIGQDFDSLETTENTFISAKKIGSLASIANQYIGSITADLYSLLFSVSPLVLFLILVSIYAIFRQKKIDRRMTTAVYIIAFIFVFYLGSAFNNVTTTVRYQIMTYPMIFILAAIGMDWLLDRIKIRDNIKIPAACIISILALTISLFSIRPHFLSYASGILPKGQIVNLKGMGEGSIEAGDYLNSLPGAKDMVIWSDKGAVCEAFLGKCHIDFKNDTFKKNNFAYFVVSTDRMSRSLKMSNGKIQNIDFNQLYATENPEFKVIIGEREANFVKVIKNNFNE